MTFHIVIILIKSVADKNENHYYDKIFFEKCSYQLAKKLSQNFVHSIIMLKFGERKVTKEKFYAGKKPIKIWDVNVDNIVISRLTETKSNSKYLIGY